MHLHFYLLETQNTGTKLVTMVTDRCESSLRTDRQLLLLSEAHRQVVKDGREQQPFPSLQKRMPMVVQMSFKTVPC